MNKGLIGSIISTCFQLDELPIGAIVELQRTDYFGIALKATTLEWSVTGRSEVFTSQRLLICYVSVKVIEFIKDPND